jgi:membrane protease YdiL (CAAX protease family)
MKKNSVLVVVRIVLALVAWCVITIGFAGLVDPELSGKMPDVIRHILGKMIVPYTVGLGLFYLIAGKMEKKEPGEELKVTASLVLKGLIIQQGLAIPVATITNILIKSLGGELGGTMEETLFGPDWAFFAVLLLFFNPVFEELLFRKLILDRLLVLGEVPAIIFSSVLFALPHFISQGTPQMFATFTIALVWGYIRVKTGRLWPCIVLHGCFNLFSGYIVQTLSKTTAGSAVIMLVFMLVFPITAVVLLIKHFRRGKYVYSKA